MSKTLRARTSLALVLAAGLLLGAVAATASSALAMEEREGCMQIGGSGDCDWCRSWCDVDQVCCPMDP